MVAIINSGQSIKQAFLYNENKVSKGVAKCIGALNYPIDVEKMTRQNKLNRLRNLVALNENVKRHCIHISLNFSPSERLSNERMVRIAETYMGKIRFAEQPCLIYRHHDAAHPHMHIVTVNVGPDGKRISMFDENHSLAGRAGRETELAFGLVSGEVRSQKWTSTRLSSSGALKVDYGKTPSKTTIAGALDQVLNTYKYTSLAQFNAVLAAYNVMAGRGEVNSLIYRNGGLVYHILDDRGKKVGVPIKASDFDCRPTLKLLEEKFNANKINRDQDITRVKNTLDLTLLGQSVDSVTALRAAMEKEGVHMVLRNDPDGNPAGITYVDFRRKSVLSEEDLGASYSATAIAKRCSGQLPAAQTILNNNWRLTDKAVDEEALHPPLTHDRDTAGHPKSEGLNQTLKMLKPVYAHHNQLRQLNSRGKQMVKKRGRHL